MPEAEPRASVQGGSGGGGGVIHAPQTGQGEGPAHLYSSAAR
jgi:hypothetical protein